MFIRNCDKKGDFSTWIKLIFVRLYLFYMLEELVYEQLVTNMCAYICVCMGMCMWRPESNIG